MMFVMIRATAVHNIPYSMHATAPIQQIAMAVHDCSPG